MNFWGKNPIIALGNSYFKSSIPGKLTLSYGVGYIELEGQVRVESRLTESDPEKLKIGMPMELVFDKFIEDEDGNDVISFAFSPLTGD